MTLKIEKNNACIFIESQITGFSDNNVNKLIKIYGENNETLSEISTIFPLLKNFVKLNNCHSVSGSNYYANQFKIVDFFAKQNSQEDYNNLIKILTKTLRIQKNESIELIKKFNNNELKQESWINYYNRILIPQWKEELSLFNKTILCYIKNTTN